MQPTHHRASALLATSLCILLVSGSAAALPRPATEGKGQLGGHLSGGFQLGDSAGGLNPYGFGLGARAGYTLDTKHPFYLGGELSYFVGEKVGGIFGTSARGNYMLFLGEVGYDFAVGPVVVRPSISLGAALLMAKLCTGGTCNGDSEGTFTMGFGGGALYPFEDIPLYVGGELRFHFLVDSNVNQIHAIRFGALIGWLF